MSSHLAHTHVKFHGKQPGPHAREPRHTEHGHGVTCAEHRIDKSPIRGCFLRFFLTAIFDFEEFSVCEKFPGSFLSARHEFRKHPYSPSKRKFTDQERSPVNCHVLPTKLRLPVVGLGIGRLKIRPLASSSRKALCALSRPTLHFVLISFSSVSVSFGSKTGTNSRTRSRSTDFGLELRACAIWALEAGTQRSWPF